MMKIFLGLVLAVLLAGCAARVPADIEYQAGGRDAEFVAEEWYSESEGGGRKSYCEWGFESANEYPGGASVTVSADDQGPGCKVIVDIPEVKAGEAASVNQFEFSLSAAEIQLIRDLLPALLGILRQ